MKKGLLLMFLLGLILTDGLGRLFQSERPEEPVPIPPPGAGDVPSAGERAVSFLARQLASADWLRPLEPLEMVPEDALLLIDAADAAAAASACLSTEFGAAVTAVDWPGLLARLDLRAGLRQPLAAGAAVLKVLVTHPLTQEIFRRRAVITLLNPTSPPQGGGVQFWLGHLLIIARPGQDSGPEALLSLLQPRRRQTVYHHGVAVQRLELNGAALHAAAVGGQLLLSLGLQPVQTGIDLFLSRLLARPQTGIVLNPDYAAAKALAQGKDDFFLHINMALLPALFGLPASAFRSADIFHQHEGAADRFTAFARFLPERPPAAWAGILPVRNRSLRRMPAELLLYFWSNWLPPGLCREFLPVQQEGLGVDAWLRERGRLGVEEMLALFGGEFSFNVAGVSTDALLPVPRISVMTEVRDQAGAARFMRRITSGLPVRSEMSSGVPVVSLLAGNGLMQPSYAFADGLLLLADSREQIESILADKPEKLAQSSAFQTVAGGLAQPANLGLFVRPAALAGGLKDIAAWAGAMIAARDEDLGKKVKVLLDEAVLPLLEGMRMFEAAGLRGAVRPLGLLIEAAALRAKE